MSLNHEHFMKMALEEARSAEAEGSTPVGCVIVRDGEVVVRGHSQVATTHDPMAHSTISTLRKACVALGTPDLPGCTVYDTLTPCPMCCGALMVAKVSTLVLGGRQDSLYSDCTVERLLELAQWGSRLTLVTGVFEEEGDTLVREWRARRPVGE